MKTNWMWTPEWSAEDNQTARIVYYRKKFYVANVPSECQIKISAACRYKLFINGIFIQDGPQKPLDSKECYFDRADLAAYINEGDNVITVEVLRYPEPNFSFGIPVSNDSLIRSPIPFLYVESVEKDIPIDGNNGWKCSINKEIKIVDEESMPAPIHAQEIVTSTDYYAGWRYINYDDSNWTDAEPKLALDIPTSDAPGNMVERTVPYMSHSNRNFVSIKEIREWDNYDKNKLISNWDDLINGRDVVTVPPNSKQVVEISADVEECGFLHYAFSKGKGAVVKTLCAECYAYPSDGTVDENGVPSPPVKGDRTDSVNGRLYGHTSIYKVAGYGTDKCNEEYYPFWFRTFRFIQLTIETKDEPLTINRFDYVDTGYPLRVKTKVQISDNSLKPVWDISLRTLKRCMHDTYMDCPFYEQLQYAMDTRSEILYTYAVAADDRLARQAIEAFRRSQRYDGLINADAPTQKSNVIPGFSIYYILMVYDHMMYFGDKKLVKENINAIDRILSFFDENINEAGLVKKIGGPLVGSKYWSFVDWTTNWNDTFGVPSVTNLGSGAITFESLIYAYGLQKSAELAAFIGKNELSTEYTIRAGKVLNAVRKNAIGIYKNQDETDIKLIQDGPGINQFSVHTQVFGILTGLVDPKTGKKMLEATIGNDEIPQASVSYAFYLFRALELVDWYEKTDEIWNLWRKMVKDNMSTCVENGTDGRSDCHAWASLILYEMAAVTLGVRPNKPGFESILIKPVTGKLSFANGDVITPKGMVHVDWKVNSNKELELFYTVPEGIEVEN